MDNADIQKLQHAVHYLTVENKKKDSRLSGVENLGKLLHEKEEECHRQKERSHNFEVALRRAEARIVQLNQLYGSGPQIGFGKGFIRPGVSRKVLEALTRDNAKFRSALEHITQLGPKGPDVAVKVTELHNLALQLRDDLKAKDKQITELEFALKAAGLDDDEELRTQITRLTADINKKERIINAKQSFCESIMKENDGLNELLIKVDGSRYFSRTEDEPSTSGAHDAVDGDHTVKSLKSELEKLQSSSLDFEQSSEMEEELSDLKKEVQDAQTQIQRLQTQEQQLMGQLEELREQLRVTQEQNEEYENQMTSLLDEFEKERRSTAVDKEHLKIALRTKCEELEVKQMEEGLMQEQLKHYENDFNRERTEADELRQSSAEQRRRIEQLQQEHTRAMDQIKRMQVESESNRNAIKYYESTNQRLLNDKKAIEGELKKYKSSHEHVVKPYPAPFCGDPFQFTDYRKPQTVGTRGGRDIQTDGAMETPEKFRGTTSNTGQNDGKLSRQSSRASATSPTTESLMQCPYCHEFTRDFEVHYKTEHDVSPSSQQYARSNRIQCSVCEAWVSAQDLDRHVKEHSGIH